MKPVFDKNGLSTEPGEIRCFYFDATTSEYMGWSDEYINPGVSMPGHSTDIDPGDDVEGKVAIYNGKKWAAIEDHRGETVYSTTGRDESIIDYIGPIREGFTGTPPLTSYDVWNGKKWITDADAMHVAHVLAADQHKKMLLDEANFITSDWRTELALGIIDDGDKAKLTEWMEYIKAVKSIDTSTAPEVKWPEKPVI